MKRLGPELRKPELRVPPFVSDLYYDLRDRRLLPLVALILVAIVAVPFLLAGGSDRPVAELKPIGGSPKGPASTSASSITVVQAEPGLRNYKRRLAGRRPTDPFKQRFTAPVLKEGTQSAVTEASTAGSSSPSTEGDTGSVEAAPNGANSGASPEPVPSQPSTPPPTGPSGGGSSGPSPEAPGQQSGFYAFAINVQITKAVTKEDGAIEESDPATHKEVLPPGTLPGQKAPVLTYIGASTKTGYPLFVVSSEVTAVSGEGKCAGGAGKCQLIELEPGFPETLVYGAAQTQYTFKVLKTYPVILDDAEPGAKSSAKSP
jgi:hypothetical protein